MADRPLGPIIKVVNGEAICRPNQAFSAKGASVVTTSNKYVGKLDNPIGPVHNPYQVIKLKDTNDDLVGEFVIAKISKKKGKRKRRRNKYKK